MNKKFYIGLIIIIIITIITILFPLRVYQESVMGALNMPIDIKENDVFEQHFKINYTNFSELGIRLSTYQKKNKHGKISVSIYKDNELIKKEIINLTKVNDNDTVYIKFDEQKDSDKASFKFIIKYEEYYDDIRLATWYGISPTGNNYLLLNGKKDKYQLYFTYNGNGKVNDFLLYDLVALCLWIIICSCNGGKQHDK